MSPSRDGWRRALARPPTEWAWHGRVWVIDALHHVKIFHFFLMSVEETMTRIYHNTIFLSTSLSLSFELEHTETRTHISRAPFSNVCLISFFFIFFPPLFSLYFSQRKTLRILSRWFLLFWDENERVSTSTKRWCDGTVGKVHHRKHHHPRAHLESIRTSSRKTFLSTFIILFSFSCFLAKRCGRTNFYHSGATFV